MKNSSIYVCSECGHESPRWLGKCPACNSWNTFAEELREPLNSKQKFGNACKVSINVVNINDVEIHSEDRHSTGINEMDRVLGGGIVIGSLILVGGDPGIGKSTLLLQVCESVDTDSKIIYVSGEESIKQIKIRAKRLDVNNSNLLIMSEVNYRAVQQAILDHKPSIVIIDSIQTMYIEELTAAPGSVSQVREVTMALMRIAKTQGITIIIIGHVTKEGSIAGPRVLEHMVDTVLYFEGERHLVYRILRAVKNRYGSTNEIGIFEMKESGLQEVPNPSFVMLSERTDGVAGSAVISSIEGTRPMLIEVQALVCPTGFGMPRRMATGVDYNRIILLMAVLEKRVGFQMQNFDAYVNVVGGLKLDEPACDLGIITAIASSVKNLYVDNSCVLIGEVGLTGEVRAVSHLEKRIKEALRVGFRTCIVPLGNKKSISSSMSLMQEFSGQDMNIIYVKNVRQAIDAALK